MVGFPLRFPPATHGSQRPKEANRDDIETAAYAQIEAALADGDVSEEDARRLSGWVAERKRTYLESIRAGRMTMEEACAAFREDIVNLARRLEDHANNS